MINEILLSGGEGAAIRCDHTQDSQTESVVRQITEEQGRLDILVNNVWGGNELPIDSKPFGRCRQCTGNTDLRILTDAECRSFTSLN